MGNIQNFRDFHAKGSKNIIFGGEQMEDSEISWMVKTKSTFGAKCAKQNLKFCHFLHEMLFLKIGMIDRCAISEILLISLVSHMVFVTKNRMIDSYDHKQNFTGVCTAQCNLDQECDFFEG